MGISDNLISHGQLPDVKAELQKLDIVVCASHEEAFPVSILEAMACSKVIVSTNVNGIPEALTHQENSLLVKPHSPEDLACQITLVIKQIKSSVIAKQARKTVEEKFSINVFISKIKKVYEIKKH